MLYEVITYAIEFRINAENPEKNFMPSVGTVTEYMAPGGPGVRLDTSLYGGYTVPARITSYNVCYTKLLRFVIIINNP